MTCLLEKLFAGLVQDECKNALLPVQYFINRDYTLDPALYQACFSDASRLCKASNDWLKESKENLILPCLAQYYRPFTSLTTGAKYKVIASRLLFYRRFITWIFLFRLRVKVETEM